VPTVCDPDDRRIDRGILLMTMVPGMECPSGDRLKRSRQTARDE